MKLSVEVLKSLIPNGRLDYSKKNVIGQCVWCGGDEFGVSINDNHRFGCFRKSKCGETGNIFKLLKKLNRFDLLGDRDNVTIKSTNYLEDVISMKEQILEELPTIEKPTGFKRLMSHPYLDKRGFTEYDYQKYEVGVTRLNVKLQDYIVILIYKAEKLVGYVSRYMKPKEEIKALETKTGRRIPRYKNSETDFSNLLLGEDECKGIDSVILVEGFFGKRRVDERLRKWGIDDIKCLCTFGAKISPTQVFLLHQLGIKNITLFYDPDVIQQIKKYANQLADEFEKVRIAIIPWEGKDPDDLTEDEMIEVLSNTRDPLNFSLNFVQILDLK